MVTIKELADKLNTHKTGIRRTIAALELTDRLQRDEKGVILIPDDVAKQVAEQYQNSTETTRNAPQHSLEHEPEQHQNTAEQPFHDVLEVLREQLKAKDQQIAAQQQTIDALTGTVGQLTSALDRAQALHAGTIAERLEDKAQPTGSEEPDAVFTDDKTESADSPRHYTEQVKTEHHVETRPAESPTADFQAGSNEVTPQESKTRSSAPQRRTRLFSFLSPRRGRRSK